MGLPIYYSMKAKCNKKKHNHISCSSGQLSYSVVQQLQKNQNQKHVLNKILNIVIIKAKTFLEDHVSCEKHQPPGSMMKIRLTENIANN